ncbi:ABC transporter permease [Candidatus Saccharibacteria bacterium]|nr:ABC transporter permease [Candidatus Saccharibacteria bacterium]
MSPRNTLATASRVLQQLGHDHRTVALLFVAPPMLLTVMKFVFQDKPLLFQSVGPMLLGIFPMIMMFLITSIVTLRERTRGTLDRLMTMPASKIDFLFGYALAFSFLGLCQALIAGGVLLGPLQVTVLGGALPTLLAVVLAAFLGTSLGLFLSAFATSEFQAIQFMPAFIFPQLLTCGLFTARTDMARPLQWFADVMPLTYSVDAMKQVTMHSNLGTDYVRDLFIVVLSGIVALILGSITIRRQTK